jgi:flavin reductase (DIM6/NTAB) family NADH-FMN oxidoreductase RutF
LLISNRDERNGEVSTNEFGRFFTEIVDPVLWLVTSAHGERRSGLIATFVTNASLVPAEPRVVIGIAKHHFTWELIDRSQAFCLHLVDQTRAEWVRRFGLASGRDGDKFHGLNPATSANGCPVFTDTIFWSECTVESSFDTGDRSLFLGQVTNCGKGSDGRPLTISEWLKTLTDQDRKENEQRLARDIAIDLAAIREWRRR